MRLLFILVLILASTTQLVQTDEYAGEYRIQYEPINSGGGVLKYNLSLKPDGAFLFHNYRSSDTSEPAEHKYGHGTWKVEKNNLIYFIPVQKMI